MPSIKIKTRKTGVADTSASSLLKDLLALKDKNPSANNKFLKTDGDDSKTLNIRFNTVFSVAKKFTSMPVGEIEKLLDNDYYEVRMAGVSVMDFQARDKKTTPERRKALYELYLHRHDRINNWDLVDRSAPYVVGGYLFDKSRAPLYKLAKSKNIWERRTSIVATYFFIRQKQIDDTFKIARILVHDKEELVQKAVGSWIREAGKQNKQKLLNFLDE